MKTASSSTTAADNRYDSRPPVFGRTVTSVFPQKPAMKHWGTGRIKAGFILVMLAWEIISNLPGLLSLRLFYTKYKKNRRPGPIRMVYSADCLDEVNGIANNLRQVGTYIRRSGHQVALVGNVFNTRTRGVIENGYVFLLPRLFSMEAIGYANTELSIPRVETVFRLLRRYPVDLIEMESPSATNWTILLCARIIGIRTIGHYRTDAMGYVRMLVPAKWIHFAVLILTRVFYRMARPVISPCEAYKKILIDEIKVPEDKVVILPRGIELALYSPSKRGNGVWESIAGENAPRRTRFLFVGRISKEKDIPYLEDLWHEFHKGRNDAELMFVGDGWYLQKLKEHFKDSPEVHYAGIRGGKELAGLYADADFFVFPSATDTFGNVVVEALASGTPAIVTDKGGPQDIIRGKDCGFVLPFHDKKAWLEQFVECTELQHSGKSDYEQMRKDAYKRSQDFTLEISASAQWNFFNSLGIGDKK
ncbi:MAG: glycosyltransferase [Fibrobacteraceae bacterium]